MKKTFIVIALSFISYLSAQNNSTNYQIIDTNAIYIDSITEKDQFFIEIESSPDSLISKAYRFIRFLGTNKFFMSYLLEEFPDEESANSFNNGFKGSYKITRKGKVKIKCDSGESRFYNKFRYIAITEDDKVIFIKYASNGGLLNVLEKLKREEIIIYTKHKIKIYSKPDW
ncbi:MAG: hypothetical protein K9J13_13590 [Saprospiraceae bacterium]|nr:hypothetical protein [Saprospiraceae bacterium]